MKYYLFRHGETYFSKNKIPYGESEQTAEILPEATKIVTKIGNYLLEKNPDACFTSPILRCKQTTHIIEGISNLKFLPDIRITEYGNETYEEMANRIGSFLDGVAGKYESIAICSHGYPLAVISALILKGSFDLSDLPNYPLTGIVIEIENKKAKEVNFRD